MPTNQNTYNTRLTSEALEKRFRDTFKSQGGAELVDDLYAQGVIVPVVDFTSQATGDVLATDLQTAWDSATELYSVNNTTTTVASNAGFWKVDLNAYLKADGNYTTSLSITDGLSSNKIWQATIAPTGTGQGQAVFDEHMVVFLRSGDSLTATSSNVDATINVWTRQIATVNGDLVNPSGFTSS